MSNTNNTPATANRPLYIVTYPQGYYAIQNQKTGKVIRSGYDTLDHPESFFREKYKVALAKTF
jgi:hypothetical protein